MISLPFKIKMAQSPVQNVEQGKVQTASWQGALAIALFAGFGLVSAVFGGRVFGEVTSLYQLASLPNPYVIPSHAALLYLVTPIVVLSSFALFLLPGVLLTIVLRQAHRIESLILFALGYSIVLSIVLSTIGKVIFGTPLSASALLILWLGTSAIIGGLMAYRLRQGTELVWPLTQGDDLRRLAQIAIALFVATALLVPKLFWENFNLDGIEAFEFGRSLSTHMLPYWEIEDGIFGFYQNFWLFAFPNSWFITLFGPIEASARLPFLIYVGALFAIIVLLIEQQSPRRLNIIEEAVLWLGMALYIVVQTYSTNYEPAYADIAENAATDTLGILMFLAATYALWSGRKAWFVTFGLLAYFAMPGGLMLLALLAGFTFLSTSPQKREQLGALGSVIGIAIVMGLAYEYVYSPLFLGGLDSQFSAINLIRRLVPPTLTELVRFNALIFTTGVLPAIALFIVLAKRELDWRAWILSGITLVYFALLYAQSWTSLHQFTPVMVLPLIVFWRLYLNTEIPLKKWLAPALALATVVAIVLSLPQHFQVSTGGRELGQATDYRIGNYETAYEDAARTTWELFGILDLGYQLQYPEQPWGIDRYAWLYYASLPKSGDVPINYVIQDANAPAPADFTEIRNEEGVSVYVRDEEAWEADKNRQFPRVVASPLYEPILRSTYRFFQNYTLANSQ